jgi:mRNA-degrading endonuclease RelE of RelBE toxin-antitoxin system
MPRLVLSRRARRERLAAPGHVGQALDDALDRLALGVLVGTPLRGNLATLYRVRIGDWRIIYEQRPDGTIRVLLIAHRSVVYRNDPR